MASKKDPSIEKYLDEIGCDDLEKRDWFHKVSRAVSRLLSGTCHIFDLADFCYFDYFGDDPKDVAMDICLADDLAGAYLEEMGLDLE